MSWLRWRMKNRVASTPMSSISSSRVTKSPRRFDIRDRSPPSTMLTICMISASNRSGSKSSAASAARIRRDVAVVVGAEHVDQPLVPALDLVEVVGDVGGEVGRLAVGADQDPVLVVAELGRPQPHRALALVDVTVAAQRLERVLDPARLAQRPLGGPGVEADAEALQRRLDPGPHRLGPEPLEPVEVVGPGAFGGELGGELGDVLALVAVLGRLGAPHPGRDRLGEHAHLGAGVVEVVLALDPIAAELEQARDRVAEGRPAAAGGGHRAGRVGAHELDQDALGRVGGARAEPLAERRAARRPPRDASGRRGRR